MQIHQKSIIINSKELKIIKKYKNLQSIDSLAREYKIPTSRIKIFLKNAGIKLRNRSEVNTRHFVLDENIFSEINTQEKAYWLGFLYADGCATRGNQLVVGLSIVDHSLLKKLSIFLYGKDFSKIYIKKNSSYQKNCKICQLTVTNKKIHDDLVKNGCIERKTAFLEFPKNIIKKELIRHFLRGYFDGDGTISIYKNKHGTCHATISWLSTPAFCKDSKDFLNQEFNIESSISDLTDRYNIRIDNIRISKNINILKMYNIFYSNATVFLDRKKQKFIEFLRSNKCNFMEEGWKGRSWKNLNMCAYSYIPDI